MKTIIEISFDTDENTTMLTNSNGDTYTSKSEELQDFLSGCEEYSQQSKNVSEEVKDIYNVDLDIKSL